MTNQSSEILKNLYYGAWHDGSDYEKGIGKDFIVKENKLLESVEEAKAAIENLIAQKVREARIDELTGLMQHHMDRNSTPPFTAINIQAIKDRISELTKENK